jgi:hypothetical protein
VTWKRHIRWTERWCFHPPQAPKPKRPRLTNEAAAARRELIRERGPVEGTWETACVTMEELVELGEEFQQSKGKEKKLGDFVVNLLVPQVSAVLSEEAGAARERYTAFRVVQGCPMQPCTNTPPLLVTAHPPPSTELPHPSAAVGGVGCGA